MPGRSELFRVVAIILLIVAFVAALAAMDRRSSTPVVNAPATPANPASDDLSVELRRCRALEPQNAGDARCVAVWEENRRRFFGRPARPLPPDKSPDAVAPATPFSGVAR